MPTRRVKQVRTTVSGTPPPERWIVPPHLRGLACQLCGFFFQDGEIHGELDLATGTFTCQTKYVPFYTADSDVHPGQGL